MCRQVGDESFERMAGCCCFEIFSPEDEIRMLEAIKTMKKIQIDAMDRRVEDLKRMGTG